MRWTRTRHPPPQINEGLRKCAVGVERNDRNQGKCIGGTGKRKKNIAENGDVKRTFAGYGDLDGVQCGRGTQCMSGSLCR